MGDIIKGKVKDITYDKCGEYKYALITIERTDSVTKKCVVIKHKISDKGGSEWIFIMKAMHDACNKHGVKISSDDDVKGKEFLWESKIVNTFIGEDGIPTVMNVLAPVEYIPDIGSIKGPEPEITPFDRGSVQVTIDTPATPQPLKTVTWGSLNCNILRVPSGHISEIALMINVPRDNYVKYIRSILKGKHVGDVIELKDIKSILRKQYDIAPDDNPSIQEVAQCLVCKMETDGIIRKPSHDEFGIYRVVLTMTQFEVGLVSKERHVKCKYNVFPGVGAAYLHVSGPNKENIVRYHKQTIYQNVFEWIVRNIMADSYYATRPFKSESVRKIIRYYYTNGGMIKPDAKLESYIDTLTNAYLAALKEFPFSGGPDKPFVKDYNKMKDEYVLNYKIPDAHKDKI